MKWMVMILAAMSMGAGPATQPTTRPSVDAELQRKIEVLQAQILMLKRAAAANLPADGTIWRMANGADLQFLPDGIVTCDKWSPGTYCEWKRIDAQTLSWVDPDGTVIRVTFASDGKACLFELLTGIKSGEFGYGVSVR